MAVWLGLTVLEFVVAVGLAVSGVLETEVVVVMWRLFVCVSYLMMICLSLLTATRLLTMV